MSLGVVREIVIEKINKHSFLNLLAKINRSTEKYHSLLKRILTVIIGLLYLQLTGHANVPWAVDIIIFMQGFPETWKLFQGFLQGKKIEKGYPTVVWDDSVLTCQMDHCRHVGYCYLCTSVSHSHCSKWAGICRYTIPEPRFVPEFHTGTCKYILHPFMFFPFVWWYILVSLLRSIPALLNFHFESWSQLSVMSTWRPWELLRWERD
jgi:hypothetical protein